VGAEVGQGRGLGAAAGALGGDKINGAVHADLEHLVDRGQVGVGLLMQHEGAELADSGQDRLSVFRMQTHLAGQPQQPQRLFEIHVGRAPALGQAGAFRLFAIAELNIGAETAGL
jgi:hypothetical protein